MKLLTLSQIGYNAPSGANWAYGIWKLDLIDTKQTYCMSYTLKENFGGDSRFTAQLKELFKVDVIQTKGVYTGTGTPKITGINKISNMENNPELIEDIKEFLK